MAEAVPNSQLTTMSVNTPQEDVSGQVVLELPTCPKAALPLRPKQPQQCTPCPTTGHLPQLRTSNFTALPTKGVAVFTKAECQPTKGAPSTSPVGIFHHPSLDPLSPGLISNTSSKDLHSSPVVFLSPTVNGAAEDGVVVMKVNAPEALDTIEQLRLSTGGRSAELTISKQPNEAPRPASPRESLSPPSLSPDQNRIGHSRAPSSNDTIPSPKSEDMKQTEEKDEENVENEEDTGDCPPTPEESLRPVHKTNTGNLVYYIHGMRIEVAARYSLIRALGLGSYGAVLEAYDNQTRRRVAIKKCHDVFGSLLDGKRILREIKLLRFLNHENILPIVDVLAPAPCATLFDEVYMVTRYIGTDLLRVIGNHQQQLGPTHLRYIMYQLLRGLKYLHSAGVAHRDLKPDNILLNRNCELVICDFGLACGVSEDGTVGAVPLTDYCCTRFYRPPELLLGSQRYTTSVDIWSAGCIFGQIVNRRPVFVGRDSAQQLQIIVQGLAIPREVVTLQMNDMVKAYMNARLGSDKKRHIEVLKRLVPFLRDPQALDFLFEMWSFHPQTRASAADLLSHPFLEAYHDPTDEPVVEEGAQFKWNMDHHTYTSERDLRAAFVKEMRHFHPELPPF